MNETLAYRAPWYYRGDPDDLFIGLLYGIVAIATIFCVECISEKVLFFKSEGIVSSDIAARISYSNSTWFDVGRWLFQRSNNPFCKRPILALIHRLFVVLVDILIIFLSLSRSIDVTERDTGITGLSFQTKRHTDITTPCLRDNIEYEGFMPKAVREVCLTTVWMSQFTVNNIYGLSQSLQRREKNVVIIAIDEGSDRLYVGDVRSNTLHSIALFMRMSGNNRMTINFGPRNATVDEAVEILLRYNCTKIAMPRLAKSIENELRKSSAVDCNVLYQGGADSILRPHELLFSHTATHKEAVPLIFKRQTSDYIPITGEQIVGTINRPRLCIFPSLILLASLGFIALVLNLRNDTEDVIYKLWVFVSQKADKDIPCNPLRSESVELKSEADLSSYSSPFPVTQFRA